MEDMIMEKEDAFITMFDVKDFNVVGLKGHEKVSKNGNISLFPNPNNGNFMISLKEMPKQKISITILNILGQKVFDKPNFILENDEVDINTEGLSRGMYFLSLAEGNN
jgi:hypothetical protein